MPILSGLLVSIFGVFATFLTKFLGVRLAAIVAAVASFTALLVGTYGALAATAAGITATFPTMLMTGVWLFVPDNASACLAAGIACDTVCALYRWNDGALQLAAKTS